MVGTRAALSVRRRSAVALLGVVLWLVRDAYAAFRWRLVGVIAGTFGAVSLQAAALGSLFAYANAVEKKGAFDLPLVPARIDGDTTSLIIVAVASAALLLMATALLLAARRWAMTIRRRYEELCMRRALALSTHLPHPAAPVANRLLAEGGLQGIARAGARACARTEDALVFSVQPLGRLVAATAGMTLLSWRYALVLVVAGSVSLLLYHDLGLRAARSSQASRAAAKPANRERRWLHDQIRHLSSPLESDDEVIDRVFSEGETARALDRYYERRFVRAKTAAVSNALTAISLPTLFLVAGFAVVSGRSTWAAFGAFLVAARFFFGSLTGLSSLVVRTARMEHDLRRYRDFVASARRAASAAPCADQPGPVRLSIPSLSSPDESHLDLRPGQRVLLLGTADVDRNLAALLQVHTVAGPDDAPTYFFVHTLPAMAEAECSARPAVIVSRQHLDPWPAGSWLDGRIVFLASTEVSNGSVGDKDPVVVVGEKGIAGWSPLEWVLQHPEVLTLAGDPFGAATDTFEEEEEEEEEGGGL